MLHVESEREDEDQAAGTTPFPIRPARLDQIVQASEFILESVNAMDLAGVWRQRLPFNGNDVKQLFPEALGEEVGQVRESGPSSSSIVV